LFCFLFVIGEFKPMIVIAVVGFFLVEYYCPDRKDVLWLWALGYERIVA
jgi:hypothetical protein